MASKQVEPLHAAARIRLIGEGLEMRSKPGAMAEMMTEALCRHLFVRSLHP